MACFYTLFENKPDSFMLGVLLQESIEISWIAAKLIFEFDGFREF